MSRLNSRVTRTKAGNSAPLSNAAPARGASRRVSSSEPDSRRPSLTPATSQPLALTLIACGRCGNATCTDSTAASRPCRLTLCAPGFSGTHSAPSPSRPTATPDAPSTVMLSICQRSAACGTGSATLASALTSSVMSSRSSAMLTRAAVTSPQFGAHSGAASRRLRSSCSTAASGVDAARSGAGASERGDQQRRGRQRRALEAAQPGRQRGCRRRRCAAAATGTTAPAARRRRCATAPAASAR